MLMAIDVGNTNMVFGLLDGERLVGSFRLMTDANRTSDEIGLTVCEYFRRLDLTMDQVTDIIIASVVPQVMYTLTSAIIKYFGKKPIIIDEDVSAGIRYQGMTAWAQTALCPAWRLWRSMVISPWWCWTSARLLLWTPSARTGNTWADVFWRVSGCLRMLYSTRLRCCPGLNSFARLLC